MNSQNGGGELGRPNIEIDQKTRSILIRFKRNNIARTITEEIEGIIVNYDYNQRNQLVAIQLLGLFAEKQWEK